MEPKDSFPCSLIPTMNQLSPIHTPILFKIRFYIILQSTPVSSF
jgi:hypothetical protein